MASDILGDIYNNIRLADQHILSLGSVVNETVVGKLNIAQNSIDQLPYTIKSNVQAIVSNNSAKIESILNSMSNDINKLSISISSLNTDLVSLIETQIDGVLEQLEITTNKITEYQEKLEELLNNSIDALNQKLDDNMESILDQFDGVKIFLQDRFGELNEYIGILHNAMKNYIKDQTTEIVGEIENSEVRMKGYMKENTEQIIDNALKNMDEIKTTVTTGFETMTENMQTMTDDIILALGDLWIQIRTFLEPLLTESPENLLKRIQKEYAVTNQFSKSFKHPDTIDIEYISPDEG